MKISDKVERQDLALVVLLLESVQLLHLKEHHAFRLIFPT